MRHFLDVVERLIRPFPADLVVPAAGLLGIGGAGLIYQGFSVQLLLPVLTAAILLTLSTLMFIAQWMAIFGRAPRRRFPVGHCVNCGHDLRGGGDRCPECGRRYIANR